MENVPQVIGRKAIKDFALWLERLESFGYKNYWQLMNAKEYGIPQNRNRCFMISLLGDYSYSFPNESELTICLKDFLDKQVQEKYYLTDKTLEMFIKHAADQRAKGNNFKFEPTTGGGRLQNQFLPETENGLATILLSNKGTQFKKLTDCAATLMARDYKGFGNQAMNAVIEKKPSKG